MISVVAGEMQVTLSTRGRFLVSPLSHCYDKIPDKSNLRKGSFRLTVWGHIMVEKSRQQELEATPYYLHSWKQRVMNTYAQFHFSFSLVLGFQPWNCAAHTWGRSSHHSYPRVKISLRLAWRLWLVTPGSVRLTIDINCHSTGLHLGRKSPEIFRIHACCLL